jgi:hypothetical protein
MGWLDDQLQNEKHIHSRREFLVDVEATARRNPMACCSPRSVSAQSWM